MNIPTKDQVTESVHAAWRWMNKPTDDQIEFIRMQTLVLLFKLNPEVNFDDVPKEDTEAQRDLGRGIPEDGSREPEDDTQKEQVAPIEIKNNEICLPREFVAESSKRVDNAKELGIHTFR